MTYFIHLVETIFQSFIDLSTYSYLYNNDFGFSKLSTMYLCPLLTLEWYRNDSF